MSWDRLSLFWRGTRRIVITAVGITVILIGVCLLVLPGPGIVVIFAGIAVLALEFAWARRIIERSKKAAKSIVRKKEMDSRLRGNDKNNTPE